MNDDDGLFSNLQDPFDRLAEMEQGLINHANHIENLVSQVKTNAQLIYQLSEQIKEMARVIDLMHKQQIHLFQLIKDNNESKE